MRPVSSPSGRRRLVAGGPWLALGVAALDGLGLVARWWSHPSAVLALLAALAAALLIARAACIVGPCLVRGPGRGSALGEALTMGGVLLALAAGGANWLLGFSGFVVLQEGMGVPLGEGGHLTGLRAGPLARGGELDVVLTLTELELLPAADGFVPLSRVVVERPGVPPRAVEVELRKAGADGPLRLHQGAFGFAPRIVVLQGERLALDRVVPFVTVRADARGLTFEGDAAVQADDLAVQGVLDLGTLDADMRGHATLRLDVQRQGLAVGRGELRLGHFADLADGWRVGFAGLQRWSEIDVSRRNYSSAVRTGLVVAATGALAWAVAAWRGW